MKKTPLFFVFDQHSNQVELTISRLPLVYRMMAFGDGVFETMRAAKGRFPLALYHFNRLKSAAETLQIEIPERLTENFITNVIENSFAPQNAKVKLFLWRQGISNYQPNTNKASWAMSIEPSSPAYIHDLGIKTIIYDQVRIAENSKISHLKSLNALPYVLAAQHAITYQSDQSILLNHQGHIVESNNSNIWLLLKDNRIITPSLHSGCIDGVFRQHLIKQAKLHNLEIIQRVNILPKDLHNTEGVLLTNALQGIQWVKSIDGFKFEKPPIISKLKEITIF